MHRAGKHFKQEVQCQTKIKYENADLTADKLKIQTLKWKRNPRTSFCHLAVHTGVPKSSNHTATKFLILCTYKKNLKLYNNTLLWRMKQETSTAGGFKF
jgi:hypothetical protein